jgi:hypothetical protein
MIHISPIVGAYLTGVLRALIVVPPRDQVPGGVKCRHCRFVVKTEAKNPTKNHEVCTKLKATEKHDPDCRWRKDQEAKERLMDRLITDGDTITVEALRRIIPNKMVEDEKRAEELVHYVDLVKERGLDVPQP